MRSKLRGKLFLRTFPSFRAPLHAFWRARRADFLSIVLPKQPYFARKTPLARLRPCRGLAGSVNGRSYAPDICGHPASREGFSPLHAEACQGGECTTYTKGLTPAAATRTMPRTRHHTIAFERGTPACPRRPLGHAELATLALRKLNRQPAGVSAALASLPLGEWRYLTARPQSPTQDTERSTVSQQTLKPVCARHEDRLNALALERSLGRKQPRTGVMEHRTALEYRTIAEEGHVFLSPVPLH